MAADSPVIRLILALEEFGKRFPGFEREVHGIEVDADGDYWMRAVIEPSGDAARPVKANGQREKPPTSAPPVKKRRGQSREAAEASHAACGSGYPLR